MHLWTHADRPLIGTRLFLAQHAASLALGGRALRARLRTAVQGLRTRQGAGTPAQPGVRSARKRARRGTRVPRPAVPETVAAVSPLEDELDPVALPETRLPSVGALLREAREAAGGELQPISTALRIRPEHLRAIEAGNYADLPAPAYAMGFIRSYADYLGLDAAEMVRRFKQESEGRLRAPELAFPRPLRQRRISLGGALVGLGILVLCGVGTWLDIHAGRQDRVAVPATPTPALLAPPPSAAAASAPSAATAETSAAALASLSPAAGALSPPQPSQAVAAHKIEVAQASRAAPAATGAANASASKAHVVLRATAQTWLEVKDGDTSIFRHLLQPGDEYPLPDKPGLSLHIGNVHGIEVLVDGRPLPSDAQPSQGHHAVVTLEARELLAKAVP